MDGTGPAPRADYGWIPCDPGRVGPWLMQAPAYPHLFWTQASG